MPRILVLIALVSMMCWSRWAEAQLPHFNPGDVLRANQLNAIVDQLNTPTGPSQPISVNCDAGDTIGQALERAKPGDIIQVSGTCHEAVLIIKNGITLDGQGLTIVDVAGTQKSAIDIDGAQRVTVQGLTVQHSEHDGVRVRRGAAVILLSVTAQNNTERGINVVLNAVAQLIDCTAQSNGLEGIRALNGADVILAGGTIVSTANGNFGLRAVSAKIGIDAGVTVTTTSNTRHGVSLDSNATLIMAGGTLMSQSNSERGIDVDEHSALRVFAGTVTVTGNATGGVQALRASYVGFTPTTGAVLAMQISGNTGNGVNIGQNASANFGSGVNIHNNTGMGMNLFDGHLTMATAIVQNNTGTDVNASLGTILDFTNNTIGTKICDVTVVHRVNGTLVPCQ